MMEKLASIGFSDWFKDRIDTDKTSIHDIARVVSVHKDSYIITKGLGDVFAEISGNLAYSAKLATDLPTTGDWVYADFYDKDTLTIIQRLFEKDLIKKKKIGNVNRLSIDRGKY